MKTYQTIEEHVAIKKHDELVGVHCDRCGNEVDAESMYDVFEAEYKRRSGSHYPEGKHVEVGTVDLCPFCANELEALLAANGYKLRTHDEA